ncbi:hypothetical protein N7478_002483 [Penicillium angulare]|uniref:uncharacterized protein n=1 Tax=Penicillium angulare TaxID=116970 RepID=UPI002541C338|nr:uncharacterized protein N7478_002483 [Penicillium angulare]KAJ5286797.1 hypothetical protein N7478_002483 [Penicillium angulare]
MFGVKRSREDDGSELVHQHKLHKLQKRDPSSQSSGFRPDSTADLDLNQTLRFRAPTLTPVDSDDELDKIGAKLVSLGQFNESFREPTVYYERQRDPAKLQRQQCKFPISKYIRPILRQQ